MRTARVLSNHQPMTIADAPASATARSPRSGSPRPATFNTASATLDGALDAPGAGAAGATGAVGAAGCAAVAALDTRDGVDASATCVSGVELPDEEEWADGF